MKWDREPAEGNRKEQNSSAPERSPRRGERPLHAVRRHVEVGDRPNQGGTEHAEAHVELLERPAAELLGGEPRAAHVEDHDVGLDPLG